MKTTVLYIALVLTLLVTWIAMAAGPVTPRASPHTIGGFLVVATCGTLPAPAYVAGAYAAATVDVTGKLCTSQ